MKETTIQTDSRTLVFNTAAGKRFVPKVEVAFVKADNKYLDFYTEQGVFTEVESLKALENQWGNDWIRVHRNALVRKSAIQVFNSVTRKLTVACQGKLAVLDVSRRQKPELRRWLKALKPVLCSGRGVQL